MARKRKNALSDPNQLLLFTTEEMSGESIIGDVRDEACVKHDDEKVPMEVTGKGLALMSNVIKLLDSFPASQVRLIAMQSAALVQGGVDELENYRIPSLPGMVLDGSVLEHVAYVSILRSFPHMVEKLGIDLSSEYREASK